MRVLLWFGFLAERANAICAPDGVNRVHLCQSLFIKGYGLYVAWIAGLVIFYSLAQISPALKRFWSRSRQVLGSVFIASTLVAFALMIVITELV